MCSRIYPKFDILSTLLASVPALNTIPRADINSLIYCSIRTSPSICISKNLISSESTESMIWKTMTAAIPNIFVSRTGFPVKWNKL